MTSNLLHSTSSSSLPIVLISRVKLHRRKPRGIDAAARDSTSTSTSADGGSDEDDAILSVDWQKLRPPPSMSMPAGGTAYAQGMVFCSQGSLAEGTGGLYYMPRGKPPEALVTGFYGRNFNSPHHVVMSRDGALWFTDPCRGFEMDFRRKPVLPCHVYRFHPESGDLRVVVDGLDRPTGIAFSPDESTAYITDTGARRGDGVQDPSRYALGLMYPRIGYWMLTVGRSATIYAYDVIARNNAPFLSSKRVFAVPISGTPQGIKCDDKGYVYAGCVDGIEVFNPSGMLHAVIEIPGE